MKTFPLIVTYLAKRFPKKISPPAGVWTLEVRLSMVVESTSAAVVSGSSVGVAYVPRSEVVHCIVDVGCGSVVVEVGSASCAVVRIVPSSTVEPVSAGVVSPWS